MKSFSSETLFIVSKIVKVIHLLLMILDRNKHCTKKNNGILAVYFLKIFRVLLKEI